MKSNETRKLDRRARERLERKGWRIGSTSDFLGLTEQEAALVEIRLRLARGLRERRERLGRSQTDLAREIGSSQSRVAKMEAADPSVSLDLLVRALLGLGASARDLARLIERPAA